MNIEEYILSGVLEAYVLGDLSEQEQKEVEHNLAKYPELKEVFTRIEDTQEKFLLQSAINPNNHVKESLLKKLDHPTSEGKNILMAPDPGSLNIWKYAAAAAVTLALISSYLAYSYRAKWQNSENDLSELIAQNKQVAQNYNIVNQRLNKIEDDIKIIDNPAFARVIMKGTANAPQSMAYVYWNESNEEVYLSLQSMKEISQENQYQLWAIIDGKPVDVGVFDSNIAGLYKMKAIPKNATAFAVTVEHRGGNTTPSLETMQVIGNVVKG